MLNENNIKKKKKKMEKFTQSLLSILSENLISYTQLVFDYVVNTKIIISNSFVFFFPLNCKTIIISFNPLRFDNNIILLLSVAVQ